MEANQQKNAKHTIKLGAVDEQKFILHKEAISGTRKSLKKLLVTAKYVDYPNNLGQTPLFYACASNNEATAVLLLESGANPNEKSQDGMTPMHAVCYRGNIFLLDKLIDAGGDLRLHDNDGCSMRDWAAKNPDAKKNAKMIEFLDQSHILALSYSDTSNYDFIARASKKPNRKSLLKKVSRRSSLEGNENLKQVQSVGFGKMCVGADQTRGGLMTVIQLVNETELIDTSFSCFDCGYNMHMQQCEWLGTPVSVKQVKSPSLTEDGIDLLIADAEQLGKLRHQNILLLMGVCQQSNLDMMLVCERVSNATLYHLLHQTKTSLEACQKFSIVQQMCTALEFIQNQNLIHCGLSSMAVYLTSTQLAKIGNFEFMVERSKAKMGKQSLVSQVSYRGFLYNWMSPELMQAKTPTNTTDIFSFCSIVWELYNGNIPWSGKEPDEIYGNVVTNRMSLDLNTPNIPPKLLAILGYGLELKEDERLAKFSSISDWLKKDSSKISKFEKEIFTEDQTMERSDTMPKSGHVEMRKERKKWLKGSGQKYESLSNTSEHYSSTPTLTNQAYGPTDKPISESGKIMVKPASHRYSGGSVGDRRSGGNVWDAYLAKTRNNNGQSQTANGNQTSDTNLLPMGRSEKAKLIRTSSQPQLRDTSDQELPNLGTKQNSVKQIASSFQDHVQAHSLRQSILKGSMAPGGRARSDMDLSISSEGNKSHVKDIHHQGGDCHEMTKEKKTSSEIEKCNQMDSLPLGKPPVKSLIPKAVRSSSLPRNSVLISSKSKSCAQVQSDPQKLSMSKSKPSMPLPPLGSDRPVSSTPKSSSKLIKPHNPDQPVSPTYVGTFQQVVRDTGTEVVSTDLEKTEKIDNQVLGLVKCFEETQLEISEPKNDSKITIGNQDTSLQENRRIIEEFLNNSLSKFKERLSPGGTQYQSPTVEVCTNKQLDGSFICQNKTVGTASPQSKHLADVREKLSFQNGGQDENDSFWCLTENKSGRDKKTDNSSLAQGDTANTRTTDQSSHCERMKIYYADFHRKKSDPEKSLSDILSRISPPNTDNKCEEISQGFGDEDMDGGASDATFTVEDLDSDDAGPCNTDSNKLSKDLEDLDGLEHWVEDQLAIIEEKMKNKKMLSGKVNADQNSPASTMCHSEVSTYEDKEITANQQDRNLITSKAAGMGDSNLLSIESAKSIQETSTCDFEFQEFYIDDEFDSSDRVVPTIPELVLDTNASTRAKFISPEFTTTTQILLGQTNRNTVYHHARKPPVNILHSQPGPETEVNLNKCNTDESSQQDRPAVGHEGCLPVEPVVNQTVDRNKVKTPNKLKQLIEYESLQNSIEKRIYGHRNELTRLDGQGTLDNSQSPDTAEDSQTFHNISSLTEGFGKVTDMLQKFGKENLASYSTETSRINSYNISESKDVDLPLINVVPCSSVENMNVVDSEIKTKEHQSRPNSMKKIVSKNVSSSQLLNQKASENIANKSGGFLKNQVSEKFIPAGTSSQQNSDKSTRSDQKILTKQTPENDSIGIRLDECSDHISNSCRADTLSHQFTGTTEKCSLKQVIEVKADSSSSDSDLWIKKNLKRIKTKIIRRRSRETYYISSDDNVSHHEDVSKNPSNTSIARKVFPRDYIRVAGGDRNSLDKVAGDNFERKVSDLVEKSLSNTEVTENMSDQHLFLKRKEMSKLEEVVKKRNRRFKKKGQVSKERMKNKSDDECGSFSPQISHKQQIDSCLDNDYDNTHPNSFCKLRKVESDYCSSVVYHNTERRSQWSSGSTGHSQLPYARSDQSMSKKSDKSIPAMTRSQLKASLEQTLKTQIDQQENKLPSSNYGCPVRRQKQAPSTAPHILSNACEEKFPQKPPRHPAKLTQKPPLKKSSQLSTLTFPRVKKSSSSRISFDDSIKKIMNKYDDSESLTDVTDYQIGFERIEEKVRNEQRCDEAFKIDHLYPTESLETCGKRSPMAQISDNNQALADSGEGAGSEDHCLTVGFTPTEKRQKGKQIQKNSGFGLHRFYFPKDRWPGGCKAKLNVRVDPREPNVHLVTSRAEDPTTGQSEILLEQTLVTSKLRSTLQMD